MAHPKPHQALPNLSLSYGIKRQLYIFCYLHVTKVNLVTQMLLQHFENFGVTILTLRPCLCCCLLFLLERPGCTVVKYSINVNCSPTHRHSTRPQGFLKKHCLHLPVSPHKAPWELGVSFCVCIARPSSLEALTIIC